MARLFLVTAFAEPFWRAAAGSAYAGLAAIAAKAVKETEYHHRHAAEWLVRLGDGTAESHRRAQDAVDALWPYTGELFTPDSPDLSAAAIVPDPARLGRTSPAGTAKSLKRLNTASLV
jgi:ring-1,2-phenylacetyl-CoA epoxidase subunit PaaC